MTPIIILALALLLPTASTADPLPNTPTILRVIDGDTVVVAAPWLPDPLEKSIAVRFWGVNTPEVYSRDPAERKKAREARLFVESMLQGHSYRVEFIEPDKYFRILGKVWVDGSDLSDLLIERGLGVPYLP
jgi:endonuclease YncB( thermonuclease family)